MCTELIAQEDVTTQKFPIHVILKKNIEIFNGTMNFEETLKK
jgi:hypothetical protein